MIYFQNFFKQPPKYSKIYLLFVVSWLKLVCKLLNRYPAPFASQYLFQNFFKQPPKYSKIYLLFVVS